MPKFHSPTYKSLRVADIGVRFVDGFYETKAKGEVARLRGLADLGVVEVKPEKESAPKAPAVKQEETVQETKGAEESKESTAPQRKSRTA